MRAIWAARTAAIAAMGSYATGTMLIAPRVIVRAFPGGATTYASRRIATMGSKVGMKQGKIAVAHAGNATERPAAVVMSVSRIGVDGSPGYAEADGQI